MDPLEFPFAHGGPPGRGRLRRQPEDFQVDEVLGFKPSGEGEHVLLQVRKRDANTRWVAERLAAFAGVRPVAVSYAGLKDRRAVTTQWFSVQLPGREDPRWQELNADGVEVLCAARHHRKLRTGTLQGNRFDILVHELVGDPRGLRTRLQSIARAGVPNYFGEQRFGRGGANLRRAEELFAGRRLKRTDRSMALSAARSWLFNQVLAERIRNGTWDTPMGGEVLMLAGSHSIFATDQPDEALLARCLVQDVHPTGPLWGRGEPATGGACRALEERVLAPSKAWQAGLERAGLRQERRALRLAVQDLEWQQPAPDQLRLRFYLERGCYATAVLRELVQAEEQVRRGSGDAT